MILYILGNGFDISHNMKTRYSDFEEFVNGNYSYKKLLYDRQYGVDNLWSNFEMNLANLDIDYLLHGISGMFDLGGDENDTLDIRCDAWFSEVITNKLVSSDELKNIFKEWVESIEIPTQSSKRNFCFGNSQECLYINFNYTTVLEKLYKINYSDILYIHGCAERAMNIIVGHGSKEFYAEKPIYRDENGEEAEVDGVDLSIYSSSEEESIMLESIAKYLNDLKKPTSEVSRQLIDFLNIKLFIKNIHKVEKICVFGHSCGLVDMPYFCSIQNYVGKDVEWEIAYYDESHVKGMRQRLTEAGLDMTNIKFINNTVISYRR